MKTSDELRRIFTIAIMASGIGFVTAHGAFANGMVLTQRLMGALFVSVVLSTGLHVYVTHKPLKAVFNVVMWASLGVFVRVMLAYFLRVL